ncbi:cytochrome P450 6k1 [Lasioglossum baleicum]|uniref:cytochrome P450 6k1 n=1 Tax=Lasioglossum baleicum TaxID=434251 RepID=UPI003FCD3E97
MVLATLIINALVILPVIGVLLYLYMNYSHTYWQKRGVPSTSGHWFFGNVKDAMLLRKNPSFLIGDLFLNAKPENDVYGFYMLHKPFLIIRNPELIKQVMIKDFHAFADRFFTAESRHDKLGSTNLFTIKNPEWRHLRTKITPVFTSGKMKNLFHLIVETTESMKNYLHSEVSGSKPKGIMMREVALKYTTDIISSVAFGVHVNSFDKNNEFFEKAQEGTTPTFRRTAQFLFMFFFPSISKYIGGQLLGNATDYFRSVFWDSMENREMSKTKRGDLIDSLIEIKSDVKDNDFKLEGDVLVSQAAIFFVAGRESSVTTICFALYELARHPIIQKRVREEILEKIKTQGLTYESVQDMKYLHQVMCETLRLYPAAPILDRVATTDYKIPGTDIVIEKGTPIYIPLCGLQRDPRYFPDPDHFDPDRFSDENKGNIKPFTYMPFGEGPRNCIGIRLGELQSTMGVITVIKDFEVSLDSTYKYGVDPHSVFLTAPHGFKLNLTKL